MNCFYTVMLKNGSNFTIETTEVGITEDTLQFYGADDELLAMFAIKELVYAVRPDKPV